MRLGINATRENLAKGPPALRVGTLLFLDRKVGRDYTVAANHRETFVQTAQQQPGVESDSQHAESLIADLMMIPNN